MQPIATDVAWSVCVCLLVTTMSSAKMAELIEVPFGIWTRMDPRNPWKGQFWGHEKCREYPA